MKLKVLGQLFYPLANSITDNQILVINQLKEQKIYVMAKTMIVP